MYHGTDNKDEIKKSGFLNPNSYFCSTLYNGKPPSWSPFGDYILYVRVEDILALFKDPHLYIDRTESQESNGNVNVYNTLNLTEGPRHTGRRLLDLTKNRYLQLRRNGHCMVMERDLGKVDKNGRNVYYWTNIMVEKKIPLGKIEHHWG